MNCNYEIIRSSRKTIAIEIRPDGRVIVRVPKRMRNADIQKFVAQKNDWIQKHLDSRQEKQSEPQQSFTEEEIRRLITEAKADLAIRVAHYASVIGVAFGRITIRVQKTRWGSCSGKRNLNLNCLLLLCPEEIRDYVVVHELCHLKQMNHSPQFWAEVESVIPDYKLRRKWLKEHGSSVINRL